MRPSDYEDGLIVHHRDDFDLYRWARMALGPVGIALGWTPIVRNQVRGQAAAQLHRFRAGDRPEPDKESGLAKPHRDFFSAGDVPFEPVAGAVDGLTSRAAPI